MPLPGLQVKKDAGNRNRSRKDIGGNVHGGIKTVEFDGLPLCG